MGDRGQRSGLDGSARRSGRTDSSRFGGQPQDVCRRQCRVTCRSELDRPSRSNTVWLVGRAGNGVGADRCVVRRRRAWRTSADDHAADDRTHAVLRHLPRRVEQQSLCRGHLGGLPLVRHPQVGGAVSLWLRPVVHQLWLDRAGGHPNRICFMRRGVDSHQYWRPCWQRCSAALCLAACVELHQASATVGRCCQGASRSRRVTNGDHRVEPSQSRVVGSGQPGSHRSAQAARRIWCWCGFEWRK